MSAGGAPAPAYQNVMRGKLQLKGKALTVEKTIGKKRKTSTVSADLVVDNQAVVAASSAAELESRAKDTRTPSERKYEEALRQKEAERVKKLAAENHREKLEKFNKALDSLPTHFDIPKVGPG